MRTPNAAYRISTPGLAEAVAACAPSPGHEALLAAIRGFPGWENAKAVTERGGMTLTARKVLGPDGQPVADNHVQWLKDRVATNGGNVAATRRQLAGEGYLLTQTELVSLFVVSDRGGARAEDFLQMVVWVQDEVIDRELFAGFVGHLEPEDLNDLLIELGRPLAQRKRFRATSYAVDQAIDVALFVSDLVEADRVLQARAAARIVTVTDDNGTTRSGTLAQMLPEAARRYPPNGKRIFDDWVMSSAGRSGARFCDHWVLASAVDDTDDKGRRHMGLVPGWTFKGKLAELKKASSDYDLMGKLEKLDARVGVPFGWYFYMLHGNRVHDWAGRQVLEAAEAGRIVLPEHDYRVLKNWRDGPYGF